MRVVVLPAENAHVLDAAADVELAIVEESYVPSTEVAVVVGSIVNKPRPKLLQSQFRIIPITQALTASGDPNFADAVRLKGEMPLRIHDLHVETRERGSTTDNLRGHVNFRDLSRHPGLPQRKGTLVDGDDVAAAERDRQSILSQPVGDVETLGLESIRLKRL